MYELRPESIKTFIEDNSVKLPRFQRKPTWGPRRSFNLAMSLFRGYPLGLVVIKRDSEGGRVKKFLLDGRQRRDALVNMREPEEVYAWAKATLRFKAGSTDEQIRQLFDDYAEEYFGIEEWELASTNSELAPELETGPVAELADLPDEPVEEDPEDELDSDDETTEGSLAGGGGGIQDLLKIILLVHPRRRTSSGFTDPFNFDKWLDGLDFVLKDLATGRRSVSATRVRIWLRGRQEVSESEDSPYPPTAEQFVEWLDQAGSLRENVSHQKLQSVVDSRWPRLLDAMNLLETIDRRLQDSQIGYLEIRDTTASDERKIFEIINTAGTPLTAAEILSAKSTWNVEITDPAGQIQSDVKQLYEDMKIPSDGKVVRWDVAATLRSRISIPSILGDS